MAARSLVRRRAQSQRDDRARRSRLRAEANRPRQIAASSAMGLPRQLGASAMKKASSERARKSEAVFPRGVSFEESVASMEEEESREVAQFTRAPGRSARLDLALLGLIAEVPGVSG